MPLPHNRVHLQLSGRGTFLQGTEKGLREIDKNGNLLGDYDLGVNAYNMAVEETTGRVVIVDHVFQFHEFDSKFKFLRTYGNSYSADQSFNSWVHVFNWSQSGQFATFDIVRGLILAHGYFKTPNPWWGGHYGIARIENGYAYPPLWITEPERQGGYFEISKQFAQRTTNISTSPNGMYVLMSQCRSLDGQGKVAIYDRDVKYNVGFINDMAPAFEIDLSRWPDSTVMGATVDNKRNIYLALKVGGKSGYSVVKLDSTGR
jgi:hypothetical protein